MKAMHIVTCLDMETREIEVDRSKAWNLEAPVVVARNSKKERTCRPGLDGVGLDDGLSITLLRIDGRRPVFE